MADKFFFYSGSADAKPGEGGKKNNTPDFMEELKTKTDYTELEQIKDWRKALSNFHVAPFILDDNEWNSVEHFFHAVKFRYDKAKSAKTPKELKKAQKNYQFYQTFTLHSDSAWSKDPKLAKRAGKTGRKLKNGKRYQDKDLTLPTDELIEMRDDFYTSNVYSKLQKLAFLAKFTQHDHLKRLLLATGNAELWHYTGKRGKPKDDPGKILFHELMTVRECIRKFDTICDLKKVSQFESSIITELLG